jgi:DNA mismatch repair ATPase MutS
VTDEGLSFDYRLQAGPAKTRNAITLLALHGAPEAVVTRALASAIAIERQRDAAQP